MKKPKSINLTKMVDTHDIKVIRKAISQIPREWQKLGMTYLQNVTRRDILLLNSLAIVTGIVVGYAAIGFRLFVALIRNAALFHHFSFEELNPAETTIGLGLLVVIPTGIFISAAVARFLGKEARGHGIPEILEAVIMKGGLMRKRTAAVKGLASAITIGMGGSVGREGPIIQIGSAIGSLIGQIARFDAKLMKPLIGCGAAAAVAASFNTPIAGVIFAVELIVLELRTRSFVPLVVASVTATMISRFYGGDEPIFTVPPYHLQSTQELFFYVLLGLLSGLVGVIFIKTVSGFDDVFQRMRVTPWWLKAIVGGLVIAGIGIYRPEIIGMGYWSVSDVLRGHTAWEILLTLAVLKIFCTSLTLAAGGSGGVFAPSLFIGAMSGGTFGYLVTNFFPSISTDYGAYALVGMAAVFSAVNRATFTAIVILFEMTLEYSIILPLMLACVAADQLAWLMIEDSLDTLKLKDLGLDIDTDMSVNVMSITLVRDIMTTEIVSVEESMTVGEARSKLLPSGHMVYPVTDPSHRLKGILKLENLRDLSNDDVRPVKDLMESTSTIVFPTDSVMKALKKIESSRDPRILVVDKNTGELRGIVSPVDFVRLSSAD